MIYRITDEGTLRLKDDLKRMRFAVEAGESTGLFFDELPSDIQRLINEVALDAKKASTDRLA